MAHSQSGHNQWKWVRSSYQTWLECDDLDPSSGWTHAISSNISSMMSEAVLMLMSMMSPASSCVSSIITKLLSVSTLLLSTHQTSSHSHDQHLCFDSYHHKHFFNTDARWSEHWSNICWYWSLLSARLLSPMIQLLLRKKIQSGLIQSLMNQNQTLQIFRVMGTVDYKLSSV